MKIIPATPIVGHVLVRPAQHSIETLNTELSTTHAHKRSIIVPIAVPTEFMRYLASAQSRSLGPHDDASGIDFVMRTIGRKFEKKDKATEVSEVCGGVGDDGKGEEEDEEDSAVEDDGVNDPSKTEVASEKVLDPSLMTASQLQQVFGERAADMSGVFFQHSTRIAGMAEFLPRNAFFTWRPTDRANLRRYCKGQASAPNLNT